MERQRVFESYNNKEQKNKLIMTIFIFLAVFVMMRYEILGSIKFLLLSTIRKVLKKIRGILKIKRNHLIKIKKS